MINICKSIGLKLCSECYESDPNVPFQENITVITFSNISIGKLGLSISLCPKHLESFISGIKGAMTADISIKTINNNN